MDVTPCVSMRPPRLHAWLRPPLNVALLLGCHGALLALLAQPQFAVACTGQVLVLGTVECPLRAGVTRFINNLSITYQLPWLCEIEFSVCGGAGAPERAGGRGKTKTRKRAQGPGGPTRIATDLVQERV